MSTHDPDGEQACLGPSILAVLSRFRARRIDGALLAEMAEVLNEEFGSLCAGRRIALVLDGSDIRVELTPEEQGMETAPRGECAAASVGFDAVAAALAA